ncbi:hypothetical protein Q7C36_008352 [Tachysurus vachellii]|uniref:Uncharacterized protein n=1 Tax=Tachysurus vachellii TaxID=175792 RepID=A0AA88NAE8_TACVA|nr:hypothetical protein Q7C36_008352 [Tachysurus vachellii]
MSCGIRGIELVPLVSDSRISGSANHKDVLAVFQKHATTLCVSKERAPKSAVVRNPPAAALSDTWTFSSSSEPCRTRAVGAFLGSAVGETLNVSREGKEKERKEMARTELLKPEKGS